MLTESKIKERVFKPIPIDLVYESMLKRMRERTTHAKYPFGLKDIDEITCGIPEKRLTVIGARPSECKTTFGLQVAMFNACMDKHVVWITREEDKEQLVERMCSNLFRVDNQKLKKGDITELMGKNPLNMLQHMDCILIDDYGFTFNEVENIIDSFDEYPDLIFIDYIQLIQHEKKYNRKDVIEDFCRKCKWTVNAKNTTIVLLSQVHRSVQNARPSISNLKDSGAIEESADTIILLWYPYRHESLTERKPPEECVYPVDKIEAIVAKQKTGSVGIVDLKFIPQNYKLTNWGKPYA